MNLNLLDTWEVTGDQFSEMYDVLEKLSNATKVIDIRSDAISIMTCKESQGSLKEHPIASVNGYLHNKNGSHNKGIEVRELTKNHGATIELLDETINQSHMLMKLGTGYFFTTKKVLKTLCQRAGSTMGDFALRDEIMIRFHRDAGYIAYMSNVPSSCKVLYREVDGAKKVFAVFASRYRVIPQYLLIKQLIKAFEVEMGEAVLKKYIVNHFDTEIFIEFPEKARDFQKVYSLPDQVTPGIRIHVSDTGDSSFIINGILRLKNAVVYIPDARYARAHTTNAEISDIAKEVEKIIFSEYTKIPERMVQLLQIDIPAPKAYSLIPKISKYCDIKGVIGKKLEEEWVDTIQNYFNMNASYTAYDVVMFFLHAATEIEEKKASRDMISKIRTSFIKSAFFDFK